MVLRSEEVAVIMKRLTDTMKTSVDGILRKVVLYGSYARGDFEYYSDIDIMFLVNSDKPYSLYDCIANEVNELSIQYLICISCQFQNIKHFYHAMNSTSFYKNIEREGVVFYDSTR